MERSTPATFAGLAREIASLACATRHDTLPSFPLHGPLLEPVRRYSLMERQANLTELSPNDHLESTITL